VDSNQYLGIRSRIHQQADTQMRTTESDLILPALRLLADSERLSTGMSTAEMAKSLRNSLKPSKEDLQILQGRNDDRLSQVIRNLVSHRTLERRGLATYSKDSRTGRGHYKLTEMGARTLTEPPSNTPTYI
jgi:hypothetical protein